MLKLSMRPKILPPICMAILRKKILKGKAKWQTDHTKALFQIAVGNKAFGVFESRAFEK